MQQKEDFSMPTIPSTENLEPEASSLSPVKILIVEDDFTFEPIWEFIFSSLGVPVQYKWAISYTEAAQLMVHTLTQEPLFHIVISDIFLSGPESGLDLWKKFAKHFPKTFLLISRSEESKVRKHTDDHADFSPTYIRKPLEPHSCIQILKEMIGMISVANKDSRT
ncbi:MAG: response regulator [Bdellovibrionales bacterium]|nr:response regulator [Bdellovibrionales bacterium]